MTKFRKIVENILCEAKQRGNLYHATDIESLIEILKTNRMYIASPEMYSYTELQSYLNHKPWQRTTPKAQWEQELANYYEYGLEEDTVGGISTTRDKNFWYIDEARLILDGDSLSNTYKIVPFDYSDGLPGDWAGESEEVIVLPKNTKKPYLDNIDAYIKGIQIHPKILNNKEYFKKIKWILSQDIPVYDINMKPLN